MQSLDKAALASAKRELLGKLDAAATATSTSSAYMHVRRARTYVEKVAAELFVEFDYPDKVHYPLGVLARTDVRRADWVDRHGNAEALERIHVSVRKLMETVDSHFESMFEEHLDFLNSVPREYVLSMWDTDKVGA